MHTARPSGSALDLAWRLRSGTVAARELVGRSVRRSREPAATSTLIATTTALAGDLAARSDARRAAGRPSSPLDGMPIVWKDLFDIAGTTTTAGSATRAGSPPAKRNSALVVRAHRAGLVTIGKANLSELAFSGLGVNQHFGTPINPSGADLVPGGSSSGSAVAVAAGIAPFAVGTDTSGSVRVPATFCGLVGLRATRGRYGPHDFAPLATTLDSVGLMAGSVADVAALDGLLATSDRAPIHEDVRVVIPRGELLERCTPRVRELFESAVDALRAKGIPVEAGWLPSLATAQSVLDEHGTIVGFEAAERHAHLLASGAPLEDATRRRVRSNLALGPEIAQVYDAMPALGRQLNRELAGRTLVCPTVPHAPPRLSEIAHDTTAYDRANASCLRTTMLLSYLGTCGVTLPLTEPDGRSTTGLLLSLPEGQDDRLLAHAARVEAALRK